ncbi:cytochrome bd ubiquinol oxidase, 14kDa subunit [Actinidia rufa]|uniref:Complex III subunit VII n=1 Tax=Actinidia rufa TaxID=165716 RepID=A0A7J0GC52_9ERIC|nr:cytochrome bd ubiquinol oxidase, 14kDa subunit [Actinidia rufa]
MASSFMKWLVDPKKNWFAAQHMKSVSQRLRRYGLRYDDLFDPYYDLDIKEALNRLPREVVDARNQRLKRAMDLSLKHEYLPEHIQVLLCYSLFDFRRLDDKKSRTFLEKIGAMQTPFRSYLQEIPARDVKRENAEREALGALPLYQRTIP